MRILFAAALALTLAACTQSARERMLERWCDSSNRCDRTEPATGTPASTGTYCTGSPHCRAQRN